MRNFDADTTIQLAANTAAMGWFIDMTLDSASYRYSSFDIPLYTVSSEPLYFDGDTLFFGGDAVTFGGTGSVKYEPNGFTVSNIRLSADMSIDRANIEFQNVDLVMSGIVLNETVVNRIVRIYFACLDSSNRIIALENMFSGFIRSWNMTVKTCPMTLGNYFMFWSKRSLRLAQATCPWSLAGTECGYSGSETLCNKTWARCTELANTLSFGGNRWLPALENKKIYWGVVPGRRIR